MITSQSEPRQEDSNSLIKNLIVLIVVGLGFCVLTPLDRACNIRARDYDRKLWEPWAATDSRQINRIRLSPFNVSGYLTISRMIETEDKTLIREIKENMNRKYLCNEDGTGGHWSSTKRIILTAYSISGEFSFVMFFHDIYPSVRYQRLRPGSSDFDPVGVGWPSAELCRILTEYIQSFPDVAWVESKSGKKEKSLPCPF